MKNNEVGKTDKFCWPGKRDADVEKSNITHLEKYLEKYVIVYAVYIS